MNPVRNEISNGAKAIFVTGTDTGVGKTIIVGLLAKFLQDKGLRVVTQKWIQTGDKGISSDIKVHLKLMGKPRPYLSLQSPYVFKLPASPHLAATKEKKKISPVKIKSDFKALAKKFDLVIVEGVGGSLVPFSKKKLVIDIAQDLKLPVLIVSANKLGAINHTLLTIEAIKKREIKIIGLIFSNTCPKVNRTILKDNPRIIESISQEKILGILPYCQNKNLLPKRFIPIGKKISSCPGFLI